MKRLQTLWSGRKGTTDTPYIIVECKKPKRKDGLEQSFDRAYGDPRRHAPKEREGGTWRLSNK